MTERSEEASRERDRRGKTVHGEAANAGHRVLAPDDAEVEATVERLFRTKKGKDLGRQALRARGRGRASAPASE